MTLPSDSVGTATSAPATSAVATPGLAAPTALPLQPLAAPSAVVAPAAHPVFGLSLVERVSNLNIHARVKITLDLQGHNYSLWRMFMELVIDMYGLRSHISPDFDNHDGDHDWRTINLHIKSWLFTTMTVELAAMLMKPGSTAYAVWASIEALFLHNQRARHVYLSAELLDQRQGDLSVNSYVAKLKRISDALRNVGKPVVDEDLVVALLRGLSDRHHMTAKLIRRTVPSPDFDTAVNMLLMDELEAVGVSTPAPSSGSALAAYGKAPAAPGSPSPNQGKTKRKRTTNNGGYPAGSSSSTGGPTAPWMGYVHAYPVPFPPPPRPFTGPGLLGARPQAHTMLAPVPYGPYTPYPPVHYGGLQYAAPPSVQQSPLYNVAPPPPQQLLIPAHGQAFGTDPPPPLSQPPAPMQQASTVHSVEQAALMNALHNLSLQNSGNGWVADSGATAHLSSNHGLPNQGGAAPMQQ